ncbi:MAG TPA: hypothetical protein VE863_07350 [Pyrinomonadaceae bacterium]|jgi:hypothetical protein|nr:hypothetical protein [Pyrinomonadaceae bacterium]
MRFSQIALGSFVIVGLALMSALHPAAGVSAVGTVTGDCKCDDLPDLIARYREVKAALLAIQYNTTAIKILEAKNGRQMRYSDKSYRSYYTEEINIAMASVKNPHGIKGRDGIDPNCGAMLDVALATNCLRPVIADDERYADQVCSNMSKGVINPGDAASIPSGWMNGFPLTEMAKIEKAGYEAEELELGGKISDLVYSCKYAKWTGTIQVTWTRETKVIEKLPHPGASAESGSGTNVTDNKYNYFGEMFIIDGEPQTSARGDLTVNNGRNVSGTTSCHANLLEWKKSPITISQTSSSSSTGLFGGHGNFNVSSIDPRTGQYTVSVDLPGMKGFGSIETDLHITGECAKKEDQKHDHVMLDPQPLDAVHASARGPAKPNALEISGTADCGKPPVIVHSALGDSTQTVTCQMIWVLRRTSAR